MAKGVRFDVTGRHPVSRKLTEAGDAKTIAHYRDPSFVLGWTPVVSGK
jgi:pectinesterase